MDMSNYRHAMRMHANSSVEHSVQLQLFSSAAFKTVFHLFMSCNVAELQPMWMIFRVSGNDHQPSHCSHRMFL
jgi:hypothetical protein